MRTGDVVTGATGLGVADLGVTSLGVTGLGGADLEALIGTPSRIGAPIKAPSRNLTGAGIGLTGTSSGLIGTWESSYLTGT